MLVLIKAWGYRGRGRGRVSHFMACDQLGVGVGVGAEYLVQVLSLA